LKERLQAYLERQGVPALQAERFSHTIVVSCAQEIEELGVQNVERYAAREAETMLEGWIAAHRPSFREVA
jgi:hypothetical protein